MTPPPHQVQSEPALTASGVPLSSPAAARSSGSALVVSVEPRHVRPLFRAKLETLVTEIESIEQRTCVAEEMHLQCFANATDSRDSSAQASG